MPSPGAGLVAELKRRKVVRIAAMYAVGAWLVVQVADATFEPLGVPGAAHRILILAAALGFPVALVLGWVFDWTSAGRVRTPAIAQGEPIAATSEVAAQAAPDEPVLAVLAFDNLSSDPEVQFFSDGVSEEIIQRLARGARLKVIARSSSFQFRGERKAEAAQALACSHVLDGSIRRAAGRVRISAHLVERVPEMSFPVSSLLRAYAFKEDWEAVDRLLALAAERQLREFQDGLPFIRTKRDPSPENIAEIRSGLETQLDETGCVDVSRLVYAAHLGLVDDAYRAAESASLGPAGGSDDLLGPDAYRPALMFQVSMPELRNDVRFPRLCARLGLVEFWAATGKWPDCADQVPYDFRAECAKARETPSEEFGVRPRARDLA